MGLAGKIGRICGKYGLCSIIFAILEQKTYKDLQMSKIFRIFARDLCVFVKADHQTGTIRTLRKTNYEKDTSNNHCVAIRVRGCAKCARRAPGRQVDWDGDRFVAFGGLFKWFVHYNEEYTGGCV